MGKSDLPVLLSMRECAFESVTASRLQRRELATETNGAIARARARVSRARRRAHAIRPGARLNFGLYNVFLTKMVKGSNLLMA
jgi:hypothetical protein